MKIDEIGGGLRQAWFEVTATDLLAVGLDVPDREGTFVVILNIDGSGGRETARLNYDLKVYWEQQGEPYEPEYKREGPDLGGLELYAKIERRREAQGLGPIRASNLAVRLHLNLTTRDHDAIRGLGIPVGPRVRLPLSLWAMAEPPGSFSFYRLHLAKAGHRLEVYDSQTLPPIGPELLRRVADLMEKVEIVPEEEL